MIISMIVAHGLNFEIGLNNQLLWKISEDLKNFKKITENHTVIMGRKTFESIASKPLPNRTCIVLSSKNINIEGIVHCNTLEEAINYCKLKKENEIFIMGGASIYKAALPFINKAYISEVDYQGEADAYLELPNDFERWSLINSVHYSALIKDDELISPAWQFKIYQKKL